MGNMILFLMETVFVAMSGGIDSSFAAYLLKKQGYRVVGMTFQLLPPTIRATTNPKACCSVETIERAKKVADHLEISHYVINLREEFQTYVIDRFIEEYRCGRTPNPCVLCNRYIKFSAFADKAFSIGADRIATGHYSTIDKIPGGYTLKKGIDARKDQSYFLYPINRDLLGLTLFPLSTFTKDRLRSESHRIAWREDNKTESQDICFVPEGDYRHFLSSFVPFQKGSIYLANGKLLGTHNGIHLFTIGQRRGLNIPYRESLYVVDIRVDENTIIVGTKEDLKRTRVVARDINILSSAEGEVKGRVRYRQKEEPCTYVISGDMLEVSFTNPLFSVTPGQSIVLYSGDTVLCGGTIVESGL